MGDGPVVAGLCRVTMFVDWRDQAEVDGGTHDSSWNPRLISAVIAGTRNVSGRLVRARGQAQGIAEQLCGQPSVTGRAVTAKQPKPAAHLLLTEGGVQRHEGGVQRHGRTSWGRLGLHRPPGR